MRLFLAAAGLALIPPAATAEVVASGPDHFTLKIEKTSSLAPDVMWKKLVKPRLWWQSAHTYSGDADNISLDLTAGGMWREDWEGGSVEHGRVIYVEEGKTLRLAAPFGPLQSMAVNATWTITLTPEGEGTKVTFDFVANGSPASGLDELAPAVDFVKTEAITALVAK